MCTLLSQCIFGYTGNLYFLLFSLTSHSHCRLKVTTTRNSRTSVKSSDSELLSMLRLNGSKNSASYLTHHWWKVSRGNNRIMVKNSKSELLIEVRLNALLPVLVYAFGCTMVESSESELSLKFWWEVVVPQLKVSNADLSTMRLKKTRKLQLMAG